MVSTVNFNVCFFRRFQPGAGPRASQRGGIMEGYEKPKQKVDGDSIYIFRYASVNIGPIKTIYIYKNNMYAPAGN